MTYEIGQASTAIPLSRQICNNFGCLYNENLMMIIGKTPSPDVSDQPHPCPIRLVPNRIASYKFKSALVPSPAVSPA